MIFKDRQGTNLNRKKIKIISQTPTEIIADVERADTITEEGTQINASVFNAFQNEINTANATASQAVTQANTATTNSTEAINLANNAIANSNQAITEANSAKETANSVSNSFNELRTSSEILNLNYSSTGADWANSSVNTLPTIFGIAATQDSNVKFYGEGNIKANVVVDGNFYGENGQKKVAYESDTVTLTTDQQIGGIKTFSNVIYSNGKQVSTACFSLSGTTLTITN